MPFGQRKYTRPYTNYGDMANIDDAINSFANETADTPIEKEVENNDKSDDDSSKE